VIPVLIDGAVMPSADVLPEVLKPLHRRNALEVRNSQFGRDAEALVQRIREALSETSHHRTKWLLIGAPVAALLLLGAFATYSGWFGALLHNKRVGSSSPDQQPEAGVKAKADEERRQAEDEARSKADPEVKFEFPHLGIFQSDLAPKPKRPQLSTRRYSSR
jgi:hypothetical protein